MQIREPKIPGAWEVTPKQLPDDRGVFPEAYKSSVFEKAVGHRFDLRQANVSVSKAGTVCGTHFADVPPSQAKYVMCPRGAVLDFVIDIRVGSPTSDQWGSVLLDNVDRKAIYLSGGLGHASIALEDDSTVMYMYLVEYAPGHEHGVSPVCPEVALGFPKTRRDGFPSESLLSKKNMAAPNLAEARESGLLPTWNAMQAYLATL